MTPRQQTLVECVLNYGKTAEQVRAIVLAGSCARGTRPADRYSDVDLLLFVQDIRFFIQTDEWLRPFGTVRISFTEHTFSGGMERRVLFEDGMDADFLFLPSADRSRLGELSGMLARAYRILLDKDGLTPCLQQIAASDVTFSRPGPQEFQNLISNFFFHVVWAAKKTARGELWVAAACVNGYMNALLLQMLEYHARALHGDSFDTWHNGRFLEQWAEPEAKAFFPEFGAAYDAASICSAIRAMSGLFHKIAVETAAIWGYNYPEDCRNFTVQWLDGNVQAILHPPLI